MPRCPECDFDLWKVRARQVAIRIRIVPDREKVLPAVADLIYCDRCGWYRHATDADIGVLDFITRPKET